MKKQSDSITTTGEVNSKAYWDFRFSNDWEENFGREQSVFFSEVAAEHFPQWLSARIDSEKLTMCDWGCAQGDGTANLSKRLNMPELTGIDFSSEAIEKAAQAYPECKFLCDDFLGDSGAQQWDILFSSNTLEHFEKPWEVLSKISGKAKKFIVLLLPFREKELIEEHFYSFQLENTPAIFGNWTLTHSSIFDTSDHQPNYWPGEQILLVYTNVAEHQEGSSLTLSEVHIESDTSIADSYRARLIETRKQAQEANAAMEDLTALLANTEQMLHKSLEDNVVYSENLLAIRARYDEVINSHSWKITQPLRFSLRVARHGLKASDKRALKNKLRSMFNRLPLPEAVKTAIRKSYTHLVRAPMSAMRGQLLAGNQFKWPTIAPAAQEKRLPDYIFWGVIDWHFRHQRPQQLAQALAGAGRRVFYVSVNLVDDPRSGFSVEQLDSAGRLFQINLYAKGAPVIYSNPPGVDIADQLKASIGEVLSWADSRELVSIVQHPFWYETAAVLPDSEVVYDCMDHHEGFGNVSEEVLSIERALMRNADITVTTSTWLDEIVSKYTSNRVLIRNAGEFAHFASKPLDTYVEPSGRQIIGYYGAIAEWFDLDLLGALAEALPECTVLMIGADTVGAAAKLSEYKNVIFTGEVAYSELPKYLHAFDVCLLPFKVIPLTLATNPVKVYEYLSAGKPVVSVDLPEIKQFENLVQAAATPEEFVLAVRRTLSAPTTPVEVQQRQLFAQNQTWTHRAEQLIHKIENERTPPRVSVIVVTYNNLELTKACLESLDEHTNHKNLEIIVVDNASADGSPAFLKEWVANGPNRKLILNDDNRGFAAGNNQGLAIADGDFLVLLNNDTYVTPGWVRTLYRHMQRNPSIGILGPVTNNIGNEAKIQISYKSMDEMLIESGKYTRSRIGKVQGLYTAAFFCVMFSRETYERIGPLDEAFGRGFFEDDDYCRRVEQLGLTINCAEDVFIHHHLSASFKKMRSAERQALFDQNKATYEAKWGEWMPHSYKNDKR
jgi:GT2 family glycosyltransferase/glycosyltransferase involved in cell wall biosynthesis